ncbi:MAG: carbamoyltransferase [Sulfurimonas sp.]|jgi:carbamoyltransferase|uniref:carbamoyltransferase family protein n=1 Tax=Sulfurimonas sp. TaxID=2022749 RepID=UPI0039E416AC
MIILGISAYYHDSAVSLIKDGVIVAAAQEERFSRLKHTSSFPSLSISYCLDEAKITLSEIDYICFYDKPLLKFERLLETYLTEAPRGLKSFMQAIPIWLKEKLYLKETLSREFTFLAQKLDVDMTKAQSKKFKKQIRPKLMFSEHHLSHAASAFFPSSFESAAILTIDGVGEWCTTSLAYGEGNKIKVLKEINFPHSLGLLYSAFTYYLGFKVNSGEYKVMGLAPYGIPKYADLIRKHLIDIKDDGSFRLDMRYFNYTTGLTMTSELFHQLFGAPPRKSESKLTQYEMDIAASLQAVTEEVMIKLARYAKEVTGSDNLCLAGGVALNCVGNGKILKENIFENIWIQPAAGDDGASLGAAYNLYYQELKNHRQINQSLPDAMQGSFLGPEYSDDEIKTYLDEVGAVYHYYEEDKLIDKTAKLLCDGNVVGWHTGRMEFGPRALGHRSILADPRNLEMQRTLNIKIKYRESFRPFAPSILEEKVSEWFDLNSKSPYMLVVAPVEKSKLIDYQQSNEGFEKLSILRSQIPAVTHVDNSARVQTVDKKINPKFHHLLRAFEERSGCPILVNTSFNIRGEPIVCSPRDSYRCFMRTEMDILVLENFLLYKDEQEKLKDENNSVEFFEMD